MNKRRVLPVLVVLWIFGGALVADESSAPAETNPVASSSQRAEFQAGGLRPLFVPGAEIKGQRDSSSKDEPSAFGCPPSGCPAVLCCDSASWCICTGIPGPDGCDPVDCAIAACAFTVGC